jgi:hypothetical protein
MNVGTHDPVGGRDVGGLSTFPLMPYINRNRDLLRVCPPQFCDHLEVTDLTNTSFSALDPRQGLLSTAPTP